MPTDEEEELPLCGVGAICIPCCVRTKCFIDLINGGVGNDLDLKAVVLFHFYCYVLCILHGVAQSWHVCVVFDSKKQGAVLPCPGGLSIAEHSITQQQKKKNKTVAFAADSDTVMADDRQGQSQSKDFCAQLAQLSKMGG